MAQQTINSSQIRDGEVKRADLNTATSGSAVIRKAVSGTGVNLSSTGADAGTGDVTFSVNTDVCITVQITNAGLGLVTGLVASQPIDIDMTVTGWTIIGDTTGSIVIDVKKSNYSGFPTTSSIAGTEKPTLSSAQKNQDLTLSSWTTAITKGDILDFYIDSVSGLNKVGLTLRGTKL